MSQLDFSIVVTTFNRAGVLAKLLQHLADQSDKRFEVVVAVDGSTDETADVLRNASVPYALRWVDTQCRGYGLAVARNLGILESTGQAVAIIDDDCFPCVEFVAAHKSSVKQRTITGGLRTPASLDDVVQVAKMQELLRLPSCRPLSFDELHAGWPKAVTTECNICLFRTDLLDLGLFSERLKLYGFIGQEFFARARHLGFSYQFNPAAEIIHYRQRDGDNNLSSHRKARQILVSSALRPALMKPDRYQEQISWARRKAETYPATCAPPPLPISALAAFPYRFLRGRLGDARRWLRKRKTTRPSD